MRLPEENTITDCMEIKNWRKGCAHIIPGTSDRKWEKIKIYIIGTSKWGYVLNAVQIRLRLERYDAKSALLKMRKVRENKEKRKLLNRQMPYERNIDFISKSSETREKNLDSAFSVENRKAVIRQ